MSLVLAGLAIAQTASAAAGTVVINEILYKPAVDGAAEFIELHNPGDTDVDLAGHTLENTVGVHGTLSGVLVAGGYGLVTQVGFDASIEWPNAVLLGTYSDGLSGGGDTIIIRDSQGGVADEVVYDDGGVWPGEPDAGDGASLELIDASTDNTVGGNWAGTATVNTPGAVNSVTLAPPLPPISGVVATPSEPNVNQTITVVATVPGGGPDPVLHYVVNFGAEVSVTMNDDGTAPDVTAGDGVFAASIPGQSAGDLVRYRIVAPGTGLEAPDGDGRRYLGVVVDDPGEVPSGLVRLEWFIPESDFDSMDQNRTQDIVVAGSVLAIDGVVYDNMEVKIRGGSFSRANLDKQAWGFDMPSGVDLDRPDIVPYPIDEFALITERGWTYGRPYLSWKTFEAAGFPTVSAQHAHVKRNGEFFGVYRMSEKLDGTWRDQNNIDGTFYKATPPGLGDPVVGFEKKQPDGGDNQTVIDLAALLDDPASAAKTASIYDELDLPSMVNFLAAAAIVGHYDSEVHNFYLHEDTQGTGRFEIYPWDLNLTIGLAGADGPCGATDLDLSCTGNMLFESLIEVPEIEEMVWRRIRTLLDGPIASGEIDSGLAAYLSAATSAERTADDNAWSAVVGYNSTAYVSSEYDARETLFSGANALPAAQPATPVIVINEIHHSPGVGVEFVELHNPSTQSVDLSGWVVDGIGLTIPNGTIALPGGYVVLTASVSDFQLAYPGAPNTVIVQFDGGLKTSGELVQVSNAAGTVIDAVEYNAVGPWPAEPNAGDVSLSLFDPSNDNADATNWGVSVALGGTPGEANDTVAGTPDPPPMVVINELHYNPVDGGVEFVELFNAEADAVDISGWDLDGMIEFPAGSTIDAGGFFATEDLALFQSLYPGIAAVEWTSGGLKGGGEGVDLRTEFGILVDELTYSDLSPWPGKADAAPSPDGEGPSLELIDPALDNELAASWETSPTVGGSPGLANGQVLCGGLAITVDLSLGQMPTIGNDVIFGTSGADTINGLAGDDTICGGAGDDIINGGNGVDTIFGEDGEDRLSGQGSNDFLNGGAGADLLNGGVGEDVLYGGIGDDDLRGQGQADLMFGGDGVDQFFGGSGNDEIHTGEGGNIGTAQVVRGQSNNDVIFGSPEADLLEGGPGLDDIFGGDGDDVLKGGLGSDELYGESGADRIEGGATRDFLYGGIGDDDLFGGLGNDQLFGEDGNDALDGQGDTDSCDGGAGVDTAAGTCESTNDVP